MTSRNSELQCTVLCEFKLNYDPVVFYNKYTQTGADPEKGMVAIQETKEEGIEGNYFL